MSPLTRRHGRRNAALAPLLTVASFLLVLTALSLAAPVRSAATQAEGIRIRVTPDAALLRPLKDRATIAIEVEGTGGDAGGPTSLSVRLTAPPAGARVSTDFPQIEGTRLIDMTVANVTGTLSWDYIFPIRGEYRLDVGATDGLGTRFYRTFAIRVHENPAKMAFLAGFVAALFVLGFVAGRIFSAPAGAAIVLTAVLAGVGSDPSLGADTGRPTDVEAKREGELTVAPARVGAPSAIRWRGTAPGSGAPDRAAVTLKVIQLEKGREIFTLHRAPAQGALEVAFQFTDASPHRVVAVAEARGWQRTTERIVEVEPVTPPLGIRVWPVGAFLLAVLAGLAAGRISKRRPLPLPWKAGQVKMDPKEAS